MRFRINTTNTIETTNATKPPTIPPIKAPDEELLLESEGVEVDSDAEPLLEGTLSGTPFALFETLSELATVCDSIVADGVVTEGETEEVVEAADTPEVIPLIPPSAVMADRYALSDASAELAAAVPEMV